MHEIYLQTVNRGGGQLTDEALQKVLEDNRELGESLHLRSGPDAQLSIKKGIRMEGTKYARLFDNGVAVMEMLGPIFPRANLMTSYSDAVSASQFTTDFVNVYMNKDVRAIVFDIDSPGGDARGIGDAADLMYSLTRKGKKPVKAYASGYMASGAYWLGSVAHDITASKTSLSGSIGVVTSMKAKSKDEIEITSSQSPNKRLDPLTEEGKDKIRVRLDDLADIFIGSVAAYRGVSTDTVLEKYGQGDVFVGPRAKRQGLIDQIGTLSSVVEEAAKDSEKPKNTRYSIPRQSYEALEGGIPSVLQFTEEEDMGLKNLLTKFKASEDTTLDAQAQDAENLESVSEASEGQEGAVVTPSAGTIEPTTGATGTTVAEQIQATVTREELEERFSDSAELFAVTLTTGSKIFPAQQAHAASQLINAKIDDFMFGGSISFVNAEGILTEGSREAAVRAMYEAMPKHSLTQNAISGIKDNTIVAKVLPEADAEMVQTEGPMSAERRAQLLGMTELGQKVMHAQK